MTPRRLSAAVRVVLAPNPGPMTLEGTNTWLLQAPDATSTAVVDPGPAVDSHLDAIVDATDGQVDAILLTHHHHDHSEAAGRLAELTGAPVLAAEPGLVPNHPAELEPGWERLRPGDWVRAGGLRIDVVATPGHSADSVCFALPDEQAVLTGDTILGRGTTVVAWPDGRLADYLSSLRRLAELGEVAVWPGHGPELASAVQAAMAYLEHREQRLEQVRAALAQGARDVGEVVAIVYDDVDRALWPAAELSVRAQLDYLRERGEYSPEQRPPHAESPA